MSPTRPPLPLTPPPPSAPNRNPSPSASVPNRNPSPPATCSINTIRAHASLNLGCLSEEAFNENVIRLAANYRGQSFTNQWGLTHIKLDRAYAHLHFLEGADAVPGTGVTIGFIESGIDEDHPHFEDTTITEIFFGTTADETGTQLSHGTAVVSIAVGRRRSGPDAFNGVAWGADVAVLADSLLDQPAPRFYAPVKLTNAMDLEDSARFKKGLELDTPILNMSFSRESVIEDYTEKGLRKNYGKTIEVLAQADREDKTILVWSASNREGKWCRPEDSSTTRCTRVGQFGARGIGKTNASSPSLWGGLPAFIPELRGHSVAVAAIGKNGNIAWYSNRCGIAAEWCIAAPGSAVMSAIFGPNSKREWGPMHGTSYAAPMVSGGLAIMKQIFRHQLSNTELVTRLFETANKTGRYADTSIYGQGLMDLGAATNPWGTLNILGPGQQALDGSIETDASATGFRPSSAMGDSFAHALAGHEIATFDELGAPFWYAADSFVHLPQHDTAPGRPDQLFANTASTHLKIGNWRLGISPGGGAQDFGHLALAANADHFDLSMSDDWSITYLNRPQKAGSETLAGIITELRPAGLSAMALQAGWMAERDSLLGSSASGAFGRLAGRTNFVAVELETDGLQGWRLTTQGEWGSVKPDASGGLLLHELSTLRTHAYRVTAHRRLSNGRTLRVALEQPLRVASGTADLNLPTGRSTDGHVVGERMTLEVVPTGRQLDLSARIDHQLAGGELALEGVLSRQPGHRADASTAWAVMMGWRTRF